MSAVGDVQETAVAGRGKICDRDRPVVAGVCLRAAGQFGLDPFVVRVVMIVLTLSGLAGFTIPAYIAGMFVFSQAGGNVSLPSMGTRRSRRVRDDATTQLDPDGAARRHRRGRRRYQPRPPPLRQGRRLTEPQE
jgi:phage shock protein PspC (stress-responsive transcriptional regulator)